MAERVLVVEDDPPVRRMLERSLAAEGFDVRAAADGGAALALAADSAPDLVVLDLTMPGLSGIDVCRRLREKGLSGGVLMLTARDAIEDRVLGLDAGADDYVVKPFAIEEVVARLHALTRRGRDQSARVGFAGIRLRRLIDDLLVLERESGAQAPERAVQLERTIAQVSEQRPNVEARIEGTATVIGEPDALARCFENLLENAAVHGPAGGHIEISMKVANGWVEVAVSDEGAGFAPGSEEAAFERFWRADEARERFGSGIGLAIVKATVERYHGTVRAKGSTVTIALAIA
jgi:DNA-binding response OmpR family regulator